MQMTFLPPFSQFHYYEVEWGTIGRLDERLHNSKLTKEEEEAIINLKRCGVMTQSQIINATWHGNKKGRQNMRRLVKFNLIDEHRLIRTIEKENGKIIRNEILFYTPRWESKKSPKYKLNVLLQKLVFTQFFLKLKQSVPVEILPAQTPFCGSLLTAEGQIPVAVLKDNTTELQNAFKQNTSDRMIIIVEQESYIENLKPFARNTVQWVLESELTILTKSKGDGNL